MKLLSLTSRNALSNILPRPTLGTVSVANWPAAFLFRLIKSAKNWNYCQSSLAALSMTVLPPPLLSFVTPAAFYVHRTFRNPITDSDNEHISPEYYSDWNGCVNPKCRAKENILHSLQMAAVWRIRTGLPDCNMTPPSQSMDSAFCGYKCIQFTLCGGGFCGDISKPWLIIGFQWLQFVDNF